MEKEFLDFKARGMFFAEVKKNGKVIETIEKHNLIVNTSCKIIAKALGGVGVTGNTAPVEIGIKKIGLGTYLKSEFDNLVSPPTSSPDKTVLDGTTVYYKNICNDDGSPIEDGDNISEVEYDETNSPNDITFKFYIGKSDFNSGIVDNPTEIWEFGLVRSDSNNTLFSMLTRLDQGKSLPIEKNEEVEISGYWKIQVRNTSA